MAFLDNDYLPYTFNTYLESLYKPSLNRVSSCCLFIPYMDLSWGFLHFLALFTSLNEKLPICCII